MARQLRIEYPGAYYHVYSRGNQRQQIFLSDEDRFFFLTCLGDAHDKYATVIHVYCLMTNHYHLLIETPQANLSRVMHLINTRYSIYFNTKHERCGHPLQGRFKATLVQAAEYACELSRYIHLNPVRAGIVDLPHTYEWSSFLDYVGRRERPPWLGTRFVLSFFGGPDEEARRLYGEFVISAVGKKLDNPLSKAASFGILGTEAFIKQVTKSRVRDKLLTPDREVPELRRLKPRPDLQGIRDEVESYLGVRNRYARRAAIFIIHKNTDYTLRQIGDLFSIGPSAVTSACRKMRAEVVGNASLARVIAEIEQHIFLQPPPEQEPRSVKVAE
jgi:REP-associated tyrosine transposase